MKWAAAICWNVAFNASLQVDNSIGQDIEGWTLEFDVPYQLVGLWPVGAALWTQGPDGHVTVNSESWNQNVPDGGILEIGFQADGGPLSPTNVLVNGIPAEESP